MRSLVRWIVPVAAAALVGGGALAQSAIAGGAPALPGRPVADVLAAVAASDVQAFSGTVLVSADLGLPSLPTTVRRSASADDLTALVTRLMSGENTLRVWADGPERQRLQLLDPFAELDVVRNGHDLWTYASAAQVATHTVLADPTGPADRTGRGKAGVPPTSPTEATPAELARRLLAAVDPTTQVTPGDPITVAGRSAYTVLVSPRAQGSLVERIVLAVDAATGAPLRVQVFAHGQAAPALQSGFTSFDPTRPAASVFAFGAPRGATLRDLKLPMQQPKHDAARPAVPARPNLAAAARPRVIGTGWTAVAELPAGALSASGTSSTDDGSAGSGPPAAGSGGRRGSADALTTLLRSATVVPEGRIVRTALLTILLTDDGRVFAGAVTPDVLRAAARG